MIAPTPSAPGPDPLGLTSARYAAACVAARTKGGHVGALDRYRAAFRRGVVDDPLLPIAAGPIAKTLLSDSPEGPVTKFTLTLGPPAPGSPPLEAESVVIPMIGRGGRLSHTLCVSSQVGCAMGCAFCQTALMGKVRDLAPAEIVAQWFLARHALGCGTITNIVFMGMGEPMDNLDAVLGAIEVLTDHNGANVAKDKITISTVGRLDGLARLSAKVREPGWHRLNLAVSVNAPNDAVRSAIMPINRAMPMGALREALENWPIYGAAKICLEYVLIPGVNDAPGHADELAGFVLARGTYEGRAPLPAMVNVIPYNPRENSPWPAPDEPSVAAFVARLLDQGCYAKRRRTKGRDSMAACGQLGNTALRRERPARLVVSASVD